MSSSYCSGFGYQGLVISVFHCKLFFVFVYLLIYLFTEFDAYSIILKQPSREIRARSFKPGRCTFENIIKRQPTHRLAKIGRSTQLRESIFDEPELAF